jgi:hypothetical protein
LVYSNYRDSSSQEFHPNGDTARSYTPLNAKGESYSAFEDNVYKIVGIYDTHISDMGSEYEMGNNAVVIPYASVKNSDENNIVAIGPMMGYTTSFQIPNGQIDQYMAKWEALGIKDLDINFYDNGYSKIKAGLEAMRNTATILFIIGAVTTLFIVILFSHLFITKQRKRTAIERSLGMSKTLCAASLLVGMMLIVIASYAFGSAVSYVLTTLTVDQVNMVGSQEAFDTTYSDWVNSADANTASVMSVSSEGTVDGVLMGAVFLPVALLIVLVNIRGNLKSEPLKMLSEKEK